MMVFLLGWCRVQDSPQLVEVLKEKKVVDAACGATYSACILEDGSLYTWGKGRYGRLGHNDLENYKYPKQVCNKVGGCVTAWLCCCAGCDQLLWCYCGIENVFMFLSMHVSSVFWPYGVPANMGCSNP